jgi:hypothetical protein
VPLVLLWGLALAIPLTLVVLHGAAASRSTNPLVQLGVVLLALWMLLWGVLWLARLYDSIHS